MGFYPSACGNVVNFLLKKKKTLIIRYDKIIDNSDGLNQLSYTLIGKTTF